MVKTAFPLPEPKYRDDSHAKRFEQANIKTEEKGGGEGRGGEKGEATDSGAAFSLVHSSRFLVLLQRFHPMLPLF